MNISMNIAVLPKAVIFDVDGTLYNHDKLKISMLLEIGKFLVVRPHKWREIKMVREYRRLREHLSMQPGFVELKIEQYRTVAQTCGCSSEVVRLIVDRWMFQRPLKYIPSLGYPAVNDLIDFLKRKKIPVAVFSDYRSFEKTEALGLSFDIKVHADDSDVNRLKPDPKGLLVAAEKLGVPVQECLFIGDRDDKDGECARRAGMPYLILNKNAKTDLADRHFSTFSDLLESMKNE